MTLPVLLCLSHLPWDFVFQRPHHLMARATRDYRVIYFEEQPIPAVDGGVSLHRRRSPEGVTVAAPVLPMDMGEADATDAKRALLEELLDGLDAPVAVAWFYTPMALAFAGDIRAETTVFDVMDELSAFRGASPALRVHEDRLLARAGVVFTGGRSLHEARRTRHPNVHCFPSSVDAAHFARARHDADDPEDQSALPRPRLGYAGVIDERLDLALLADLAARRPDWSIVMLGPTAKISADDLPRAPNLHWLGLKPYAALPSYLANWDVALMPFALNAATQFISPTKTPEYLAAGRPVIATPIADVVRDWGELVAIESSANGFVSAAERLMAADPAPWLGRVDARLRGMSWDATWARMADLVGAEALEGV